MSLIFVLNSEANAEDLEKPYKSKTADECVYEKACVWHHFLLGIQQKPDEGLSENINIKKWYNPIFFRRVGNSESINSELIDGYLKQIEPYFLQKMYGQEKYNFLIVITDSVQDELSGEFKDTFYKAFGSDLAQKIYQDTNPINQKCFYFHMQSPEHGMKIYSYFAFIQRNHPDIKNCLKQAIYSGFGIADLSKTDLIAKEKSKHYTKLELILVFMLYQDYFQPGMAINEVKQVFDKIYEPLVKFVDDNGVIKKV